MKLHANHRTYPSSRRLICRRVLEEGGRSLKRPRLPVAASAPRASGSSAIGKATARSATAHRVPGAVPPAFLPSASRRSRRCGGCG